MNPRPRISLRDGVFRAEPWTGPPPAEGWRSVLAVYASDDPGAPAVLGSYGWDPEGAVTFRPRFAPSAGVALRAVFRPQGADLVVMERFAAVAPPAKAPTTRVLSLTPSAPVWPENILKLYLTFSAPMRIGTAWVHLRLRDEDGAVVPGAFVEIDQELWDPAGTRLTVLFDPARIKRGLVDHEAEGLPLVPGRRYRLEVDRAWKDARGAPLVEGLAREITASEAVRDPIDPAAWLVTPPKQADGSLSVSFGRPLDAALAMRALSVWCGKVEVGGRAALDVYETRWTFTPTYLWASGKYALKADPVLEDLCGNRIARAFDIDVAAGEPTLAKGAERTFELKF